MFALLNHLKRVTISSKNTQVVGFMKSIPKPPPLPIMEFSDLACPRNDRKISSYQR